MSALVLKQYFNTVWGWSGIQLIIAPTLRPQEVGTALSAKRKASIYSKVSTI